MRSKQQGESTRLTRRFSAKVLAVGACAALVACMAFVGCSSQSSEEQAEEPAAQEEVEATLEGHELNIYCGAGMTDPFQEIAAAFQEETGCTVNVTYANAAQIQTQISTTEEGDFFIAGAANELQPVADYVDSQVDLVKHIPVLAVPADNPKNITGLADLATVERLLIGDPDSTPIGKVAQQALTQAGVWDALSASGAITTTTTAPQIATALANGEGDAGIVWKENVTDDGAIIVETTDLDVYIKTIPAATLTCAADADAVQAFGEFLQTDTAWDIWARYGYERV